MSDFSAFYSLATHLYITEINFFIIILLAATTQIYTCLTHARHFRFKKRKKLSEKKIENRCNARRREENTFELGNWTESGKEIIGSRELARTGAVGVVCLLLRSIASVSFFWLVCVRVVSWWIFFVRAELKSG